MFVDIKVSHKLYSSKCYVGAVSHNIFQKIQKYGICFRCSSRNTRLQTPLTTKNDDDEICRPKAASDFTELELFYDRLKSTITAIVSLKIMQQEQMNAMIMERVGDGILQAAEAREKALDAKLASLENMDEDDFETLRQKRKLDLQKKMRKEQDWRQLGHGRSVH